MGRKKLWTEDMQSRFPAGTFAKIESVLNEGEDRTDFVREAVVRELQRRLANKKGPSRKARPQYITVTR